MQTPWVVAGSRSLCRTFVNRDFNRAQQLLEISPTLINIRHPLGWAPLHVVILCGDPSLVKFVLDLPGIDITIQDSSTFNATESPAADILCRHKEFSPNICGTECTFGATALHFACMRGDLEVLNLLLEMHVAHDVRDYSKRLPQEYFDLERVNLETFKAYHIASKAWYTRWRSLAKKDVTVLCGAIREGDYDYCKEILDTKPELARDDHPSVLIALQMAVADRKPANINLILPQSNGHYSRSMSDDSDEDDSDEDVSHGLFGFHRTVRRLEHGSTPLHYACLLGNMKIVELLLRNGAEWIISDSNDLLPEDYTSVNGDSKVQEFKHLCREEEELRRTGRFAEELELDREKEKTELEPPKKHQVQKVVERKTKLGEEEELRKRHLEIEKIIGDKIIGQRGPIRSIASAIRLRENGWVDPDRPLVMLFLGSSGIGKTELAKQVACYLHGDGSKERPVSGAFVRIDMSEYQHSHTVSNLTGSPKGYVGYDHGGILTTKLKNNPEAIVLLDEIEKAHPDVLTVFLQLFDDGRITDPLLGTIYCKGAVFIMTSNLGSEEIRAAAPKLHKLVAKTEDRQEQYLKGIGQFNKQLYPILKESFKRDEFLGRINQTVVFLPFIDQEISQIVEIELKKWKKRAEEQHVIRLDWSPKVVDRLVQGYDVNYGARSVINEVQTLAVQILADSQIRGDIRKNWLVHLFINDAGDIDMAKEDPIGRIPQRGCHYVF
ncbi:P-loop containing nucleoside triphosphate hydrolase protein [Flammula alnicola]|nr:P-loop containing nucleoside triphosphate hydrolase protein [Flammula alnicola]